MKGMAVLKRGREKPVRNRHPWIFSGAVARMDGSVEDGDLVGVMDNRGRYLATGYINRRSQIMIRLLTWDEDQAVNANFWRRRLQRALAGRSRVIDDPKTDAYRIVHAEADGFPGLIVDYYAGWLVVQCLTLGMERQLEQIANLLVELLEPVGVYTRNDVDVRHKEGLPLSKGSVWGAAPPDLVEIVEHGRRYWVNLKKGHKTGFYLDQRDNRSRLARMSAGKEVLNAFAYTGGFGVSAGLAGARATINIDTSVESLSLAEANLELNGCGPQEMVVGDVFEVLRQYRAERRLFDVVILDPPKFATSQGQVAAASRGYKDVNLLAMHLLRSGGLLMTFSCSGLISADLFQKIVFGASVDAGRDVQIVERLAQAADHPVLLTFPESAYLKGLLCRVW